MKSSSLSTNGVEDAGSKHDAPDDDDGSAHNEIGSGDGNDLIAAVQLSKLHNSFDNNFNDCCGYHKK